MSVVAPPIVEPAQELSATLNESPHFMRRLLHQRLAVVCLAYLALLVVIAIVAPIVLPGVSTDNAGDLGATLKGPSGAHLLGTDSLGRDVLQRLLVGTGVTLLGVGEAVLTILVLGVPPGLAAGFYGGWIDRVVTWLADLAFSIPGIVVILVVLAVFPGNMAVAMITFGIIAAPGLMRVVRSATLSVREELYVAAAQVAGLSRPRIIWRHILPRIAGPVIVQTSLLAGVALIVQTGLAFLNLVVKAPAPSWGGMVAEGVQVLVLQPWLIWPPGIAIGVTILVLGLLGDAVRDASTEGWSAPITRAPRRRGRVAVAPVAAVETASDALLSVEHLSVVFDSPAGPVTVVQGVSFEIRAGEALAVVGESGCGKSVTAMAILGLLPGGGRIGDGRIMFDDRDLTELSERELRHLRGREIAVVSQEPIVSLNPAFQVGWQLAELVRQHTGASRRDARARAIELLRQVRLPNPEAVAHRYPHELSGGMAQRVGIARALAGEPRLLIADEPTTALDVTVQSEILDLLREIQREREMAILLVTHDWGVAADICDAAVVMYAGEVVERAGLLAMVRRPLHPYTEALLASNPHHAVGSGPLPTIPGVVPQPGEWPSGCHFHPRCRYATEACRQGRVPLERRPDGRETRCIHVEQLVAR